MSEQLNQQLGKQAERFNPLRKGIAWWLIVIDGIIALGIGVFALLQPLQFADLLGVLIGGYLLIVSVLRILADLRGTNAGAVQPIDLIRDGVGLITGLVGVLQPLLTGLNTASTITVLALGLAVYSILGLIGLITNKQPDRIGVVLINALPLVLAILLFYSLSAGVSQTVITIIGVALVIAGIALIGYGAKVFRALRTPPPAPAAPAPTAPAPTPPTPPPAPPADSTPAT